MAHSRPNVIAAAFVLLALLLPDGTEASRDLLKKKPNPKATVQAASSKAPLRTAGPGRPYNIAHRGSSGELPEETREDWTQAIELGAEFIEGDCVLTKDGHLVMRHEPNLSNTTNASDLFPDRITTYIIDFLPSTGVHAIDLTLAEIRTLRARQRLYFRDQSYNDKFKILTLGEYLDIAINAPRTVGAYPETKHPTWHDSFKLPALKGEKFSQLFLDIIKSKGYGGKLNSKRWLKQPIFLQSFEVKNLKYLRARTELPLVQLLSSAATPVPDLGKGTLGPKTNSSVYQPGHTYGSIFSKNGLPKTAKYADALGPDKATILINDTAGSTSTTTSDLISRAHKLGLQVAPYTFRNEHVFFADNFKTINDEYQAALDAGVDGLFTDYTEGFKFFLRDANYNGNK